MRLFDLDEGLYVTCARQMALSGDFVTPRLNVRPHDLSGRTTVPFFEKPPMVYWVCAASFRLFGIAELTARLPVACASLAATLLVVYAGMRWFGRRAALLAGIAYAAAPMTIVDARQMTTDALLTLWFLIAMLAYWERRPLVFWLSCALGVLTKGVVGLLLPVMVISVLHGVRVISTRRPGLPLRLLPMPSRSSLMQFALGVLLFLAITLPWHLAILKAGGRDAEGRTWVQEYLIRQHVGRFKGKDTVHNAPLPTYIGYFLIGFFPWACFTPFAFRFPGRGANAVYPQMTQIDADKSGQAEETADNKDDFVLQGAMDSGELRQLQAQNETQRFLLCWFWTIFVFFSLSAAKLPNYIVPVYPAAALLVGRWLDYMLVRSGQAADSGGAKSMDALSQENAESSAPDPLHEPGQNRDMRAARSSERSVMPSRGGLPVGAFAALCTALLFLLTVLFLPYFTRGRPVMPDAAAALTLLLALVATIGCFCSWVCLRRADRGPHWRYAGLAMLTGMVVLLTGLVAGPGYAVANRWIFGPYQDLAIMARADARQGFPVVCYMFRDREASMLYYARDYSPLERKETPLLPFLRPYLPSERPEADIILTRANYEKQFRQELTAAHWEADVLAMRDSGLATWLLLRIRPLPGASRLSKPDQTSVRRIVRRIDSWQR